MLRRFSEDSHGISLVMDGVVGFESMQAFFFSYL